MATIGYARVSSADQEFNGQIERLQAAGCERVYSEKVSGKSTNGRPKLARAIAALGTGDVLVVVRLDRLARSIRDLLQLLDQIAAAGAGLRALEDPWCDTTTPQGRLILTVMGGLAQFERELIRQRCDEGIRRARERGVAFGRPPRLNPRQRHMIAERYAAGETLAELAADFGVGEATVWRALRG
jgi:DNA invertase Pin-like site-specific DNA recombinase